MRINISSLICSQFAAIVWKLRRFPVRFGLAPDLLLSYSSHQAASPGLDSSNQIRTNKILNRILSKILKLLNKILAPELLLSHSSHQAWSPGLSQVWTQVTILGPTKYWRDLFRKGKLGKNVFSVISYGKPWREWIGLYWWTIKRVIPGVKIFESSCIA